MTTNKIEFPDAPTYWFSHNDDKKFFHCGLLGSDQVIENAHDTFDTFTKESDLVVTAECEGIDPHFVYEIVRSDYDNEEKEEELKVKGIENELC